MSVLAPAATPAHPRIGGRAVVLIAHGSPDPRHATSIRQLAARVAAHLDGPVTASFLEHDHPRAERTPADIEPGSRSVVIPLLMTAGYHWRHDIPPLVAHQGSRTILLPPPEPAHFVDAVREAAEAAADLVLVGAGSSRPEVVARFSRLAARVEAVPGVASVGVALSPRDLPQVIRPGCTVVPILTAEGVIADRIRTAAGSTDHVEVTPVLGDTHSFAATLAALADDH